MATWVITGANRGLGLEFAKQLLAEGHTIIAGVRNPAAMNFHHEHDDCVSTRCRFDNIG